MKIYNHIKLDIDTWEVIEEDSYEYNGIVTECQRNNNSGCPEDKVKECKAWPCNINDTTNETMIIDWCISSSSSSVSSSSSSSSISSISSSSSSVSSSSISSSSSSSSVSSTSSSSSSSYSSNCAEDLFNIPSGSQPDYHKWQVIQNDGGFGAGAPGNVYSPTPSGLTHPNFLRYNSKNSVDGQSYLTLYRSRWYFPANTSFDIAIDWTLDYFDIPHLGNSFALVIKQQGGAGDWIRVQENWNGGPNTNTKYRIHENSGGLQSEYDAPDAPDNGKFRIKKVMTSPPPFPSHDLFIYVWQNNQWEWNGNPAGFLTGQAFSEFSNIEIELMFTHSGFNSGGTKYIDVGMYNFRIFSFDSIVCGSSSSSSISSSSSSVSSSSSSLSSSSSSSSVSSSSISSSSESI